MNWLDFIGTGVEVAGAVLAAGGAALARRHRLRRWREVARLTGLPPLTKRSVNSLLEGEIDGHRVRVRNQLPRLRRRGNRGKATPEDPGTRPAVTVEFQPPAEGLELRRRGALIARGSSEPGSSAPEGVKELYKVLRSPAPSYWTEARESALREAVSVVELVRDGTVHSTLPPGRSWTAEDVAMRVRVSLALARALHVVADVGFSVPESVEPHSATPVALMQETAVEPPEVAVEDPAEPQTVRPPDASADPSESSEPAALLPSEESVEEPVAAPQNVADDTEEVPPLDGLDLARELFREGRHGFEVREDFAARLAGRTVRVTGEVLGTPRSGCVELSLGLLAPDELVPRELRAVVELSEPLGAGSDGRLELVGVAQDRDPFLRKLALSHGRPA